MLISWLLLKCFSYPLNKIGKTNIIFNTVKAYCMFIIVFPNRLGIAQNLHFIFKCYTLASDTTLLFFLLFLQKAYMATSKKRHMFMSNIYMWANYYTVYVIISIALVVFLWGFWYTWNMSYLCNNGGVLFCSSRV